MLQEPPPAALETLPPESIFFFALHALLTIPVCHTVSSLMPYFWVPFDQISVLDLALIFLFQTIVVLDCMCVPCHLFLRQGRMH